MKIALSIPKYGNIDSNLPSGVPTGGLDGAKKGIILPILEILVVGAVLFALYQLVTGGLNIIMSRGNKEKVKKAREKIINAILGLIFIFLSFLAINILGSFIGTSLFPFFD